MLIFENGGWQTNSDYPDANYLKDTSEMQPKWVVHDNSEVAAKVMSTPYWEAVENEEGQLVDIIPVVPPVTDEEHISQLKNELEELDRQAIRPLRAVAAGNDTEEDRDKLAELEEQAEVIRLELAKLEGCAAASESSWQEVE